VSDHDERRLSGIGRELWPDPASAYRELLAARAHRRRRAAGLGGVAAFTVAAAAVAILVLPGGHRAAARGIVVGGAPTPAPPTVTATTPTPSGGEGPGLATPAPTPTNAQPGPDDVLAPAVGAIITATDTRGADSRFEPATVTITAGFAVRFVNSGTVPHAATAGDGTWRSPSLAPGQSATTPAFQTSGVFTYYLENQQAPQTLGMPTTIIVLPSPGLGPPPLPEVAAVPPPRPTPAPTPSPQPAAPLPPLNAGKVVPSPGANP